LQNEPNANNTRPSRSEQYDALVIHNFDGNSNEPLDLVKELFESAIANYALLKSLPTINVLITNSGTSENKASNSDWKRKRSVKIATLYNEDLDNAFQIMERTLISLLTGEIQNTIPFSKI
jgi:hypothetical protein